MGEAADRKVTEIEETRKQIESDLIELEERIPAPRRSVKALVGGLVGTAGGMLVLKKLVSLRKDKKPEAEVVVRVVSEDVRIDPPADGDHGWRSRSASKRSSKG